MTPAPKRHWFRFSLRTLFVVVTVFGCWLGYELNWIRQRRELMSRPNVEALVWATEPPSWPRAPGLLGLFGEKGRHQIKIVVDLPLAPTDEVPLDRQRTADEQALLERAKSLFPEADAFEVSLAYMRAIKRRP
jgi:hypothetical protein